MSTRRAVLTASVIASVSLAERAVGDRRALAQGDVDYSDFAPPDLRLTLRLLNVHGDEADDALLDQMIIILTERAKRLDARLIHVERLVGSDIILSVRGTSDVVLTIVTLSRTGLLEIIDPQGAFLQSGVLVATSLGGIPKSPRSGATATPTPVYQTILSSADVTDAFLSSNEIGAFVVGFKVTEDAGERLRAFTEANIGQPMAIVIDNLVVITAVINAPIFTEGIIDGLDPEEAESLVIQLNSDPLPGRIELIAVDQSQ